MPLPFLTKTRAKTKASQLTPVGPKPDTSTSETWQGKIQKAKRYEFARGFIPDTITILDSNTRHAVYHLSGGDFDSTPNSTRSRASCIRLRNARTQEILATIQPRRLFRDVVTLHSTASLLPATSKKVRMNCFERTGLLEVLSHNSSPLFHIPNPGNLGLPKGASLFWKTSSDKRSMTFHSTTNDGGTSSTLAHASFAQSIASGKLVSVEVTDNIAEMLLVYIFISASIMEVRVRKECQREEEELYLQHTTHPLWMMVPFGASYFII